MLQALFGTQAMPANMHKTCSTAVGSQLSPHGIHMHATNAAALVPGAHAALHNIPWTPA
jgi:hypothetical protein